MNKHLSDDSDPRGSAKKTPKGAGDDGHQPQEGGDDEPPDDGFLPNHDESPSMKESHFSVFFQWICGIAASLVTVGIVWMANISVSTARKVDVLIDRPQSVPRWQYESDVRQLKDDINETKRRVTAVETRQIEGIARSNDTR